MPLTKDCKKANLPLAGCTVLDWVKKAVPQSMPLSVYESDAGAVYAFSQAVSLVEPTLVLCGDNYFENSLEHFVAAYHGYPVLGACDVSRKELARQYGVLEVDEASRRLLKIHEKPLEPPGTLVSTGVYIMPPTVYQLIRGYARDNPAANLGELMAHLLTATPIEYQVIDGAWIDIGTPETYKAADAFIRQRFNIKL